MVLAGNTFARQCQLPSVEYVQHGTRTEGHEVVECVLSSRVTVEELRCSCERRRAASGLGI